VTLIELLRSRCARALDEDAEGNLLVASNLTGTFQLYELAGGALRRLTDFEEPVSGRYLPGRRQGVLSMDVGGSERHQLYRFDLDEPPGGDTSRLEALTGDAGFVHDLVGVADDGRLIAYVCNRRNGVDFDVWTLDLDTGEDRCVYAEGGWCQEASGFSPGGRWLSVTRPGSRPLDRDLLLLDLRTGGVSVVLEHPDEAAIVGTAVWSGDDAMFLSSNVGRDLSAIARYDLGSGRGEVVVERPYDLECYGSADGRRLLVVGNDAGTCRAEVFSVADGGSLTGATDVPLPGAGVISFSLLTPPPLLARDGDRVTYTYSSPSVPGDVWSWETRSGVLRRLTTSPGPPAPAGSMLIEPTRHEVTSFDGEQVPVFLYRPEAGSAGGGGEALPAVLFIHGGPEAQSVAAFNPVVQGLVGAGYGVVVPNVRGSTGYGRRYAALDDTTRRLDSVADLAAIHDWLPSAGLDPTRAALWGGSYGGYMVLAGCAFQPERWAAGVDVVGISDLVTFLENTSAYRRSHREHEYGSLATDRAFLESASPLRAVADMRAPLFVIHGANDPRVPLSEAEQLVASLRRRGIPCELVVYEDEGHGLQKLSNQLDAYPRAFEFLGGVLGPPATGRPTG
jgi:dipeptidyl aminopeptidase/acylaminoacyl peptidase